MPLPRGRTVSYYAHRVAERFGQTVEWYYDLPRDAQGDYHAYEMIREEEEADELRLLATSRGLQ